MKLLAVLLLFLSGCATISEYNKGCRDSISGIRNLIREDMQRLTKPDAIEYFCNGLELTYIRERRAERELNRGPRFDRERIRR